MQKTFIRPVGLWLLFLPMLAVAQSNPNGSLNGTVQDTTGAVLPGVMVTVKSTSTGQRRTIETNTVGRWTASALPVGIYQVSFELSGFKTFVKDGIAVEAAVPRTVDTRLEIGAGKSEEITVVADALLATPETAATFRQITSQELLQVPTSTRSFTHLLSAEAGVSADLPPVLTNGNGNISPSVNGTRTTSTSLSFNGIDATNLASNEGSLANNISPAPETLQEVKLQTSLYDASTGRSGGGNFQLITKSGTNKLHGAAYWYVQNEKFNANDFFFNEDGIDRPKARRNEGGFVVGGPIKTDRVFFFGGYQRTEALTGFVPTASSITVLPQALQLIGGERTRENLLAAFAQLNPDITTSIPKAQCASASDRACIPDVAVKLLNLRNPVTGNYFIPAPRAGGQVVGNDISVAGSAGGNPFVRQRNVVPASFKQDQFTTRIDGRLSSMNTLSGTFFFANFPGFDPFPDPLSLASPVTLKRNDRNRTLAAADTHIINQRITNEFRVGYFSLNNTRILDDAFLGITNESVGIPNPALFFDQGPGTQRLGHYVGRPGTLLERFSFGGPNDTFNRREQSTKSVSDSLSWAVGQLGSISSGSV
jgi:hypothetical protein